MAICMNCGPTLLYPDHARCVGEVWSQTERRVMPCECTENGHDYTEARRRAATLRRPTRERT
jgi:hypothetical protein